MRKAPAANNPSRKEVMSRLVNAGIACCNLLTASLLALVGLAAGVMTLSPSRAVRPPGHDRPGAGHNRLGVTFAFCAMRSVIRRAPNRSWEGIMRSATLLAFVLALIAASPLLAQITSNPLHAPIEKKGLAVEVRDFARLPDTRGKHGDDDVMPLGWARISYVRDLPDGRRFANDSRGFIYFFDKDNKPTLFADTAAAFPYAIYNGLQSGLLGFVFHPDFARNGLFYTVHSERVPGNPKTPDFIPPGYGLKDVTYHNVITEWHATNPAANVFQGTRREILREAHVVALLFHPMSAVEFNPRQSPATPITGCFIRAAAIMVSAMAMARTRTIRRRRSGSIRS